MLVKKIQAIIITNRIHVIKIFHIYTYIVVEVGFRAERSRREDDFGLRCYGDLVIPLVLLVAITPHSSALLMMPPQLTLKEKPQTEGARQVVLVLVFDLTTPPTRNDGGFWPKAALEDPYVVLEIPSIVQQL